MPKQRLDVRVHTLGLTESREMARRLIMAGEVLVNGQLVDRPAAGVDEAAAITLKAKPRFVSRGGEKLDAALAQFPLDVAGRVCADVGASTGGFTDCLLQRGAAKVYAIDVGRGILEHRLRRDPRVVVMEETNARHLESLPEPVTFVSVDASFISLKLLLPAVKDWLTADGNVVALIKPQFEAGRQAVSRGSGVIRDPRIHRQVLEEVLTSARDLGFGLRGLIASPLLGPKGNREFLAWLDLATAGVPAPDLIDAVLGAAEPDTEE